MSESLLLHTPRATRGGSSTENAAALLPTPTSSVDSGGVNLETGEMYGSHGVTQRDAVALLPTPVVNDMGDGKTPEHWDEWTAEMQARHGNGNGHGKSLSIEAQRLPVTESKWGRYTEAVTRWETLTRPSPDPLMDGARGGRVLNPAFAEWMMGWPAGHVTDVPGVSHEAQLRAIGNGVVDRQAAEAIRVMLAYLVRIGIVRVERAA